MTVPALTQAYGESLVSACTRPRRDSGTDTFEKQWTDNAGGMRICNDDHVMIRRSCCGRSK
jgi:hypothetical protein